MLERLTRTLILRRKRVLGITILVIIFAGAFGGNVAKHMSNGGFDDPNSESARAAETLKHAFGTGNPNFVLLITAKPGVDSPAAQRAGGAIETKLAHSPNVKQVVGYFTTHSPALRSKSGSQAIVVAQITGSDDQISTRVKTLSKQFTSKGSMVSVSVGGFAEIFRQVGSTIQADLAKAEAIALPITFLALVVVFGGLVAASLPLAIGITAILGTFLVLRLLTLVTSVSIFSLNMTTAMGLGLGIDYALFIVSRYREELRAGADQDDALVTTMQTAGRTIIFSALTVALSMSALLVFPLFFLRSFAYAGIAVVLIAMAGALIVLPALLAVLGPRVDSLVLWRRTPKPFGEGVWHRIAVTVMKRPIAIGSVVAVILLALGTPFLSVHFGLPDDRVLPASASSRITMQMIHDNFSFHDTDKLTIVAEGAHVTNKASRADLDTYAKHLSQLSGVGRVETVTGRYRNGHQVAGPATVTGILAKQYARPAGVTLAVIPTIESYSRAGEQLVKDVRAVPAPFPVGVTGAAPQLVDVEHSLFSRMPLAMAIIGLATFILLFLLTGSVVVPLKALVLNLLSLSAMFGAMVWIFQQGHLRWLFGNFLATGYLDTTTPILMFCVAFGLSMDYEVFLLSRIKEEYDLTGDTRASVAAGLERTGGIVTSAAALFAIINISFTTSGITFIKLFGLGLTIAVILDATLVRAALVPSVMRLMGDLNWWAPSWARKIHARFGFTESGRRPAAESGVA